MNKSLLLIPIILSLALVPIMVDAHTSGCHGWHSCPSDVDPPTYQCGDTGHDKYCPVKVSTDKLVYDRDEFIIIKGTVDERTGEGKIGDGSIGNQVQISIMGGGVSAGMSAQIDSKNQFIRAYIPTNLHNQDSEYTLTVTYGTLKGITTFTVLN